MPNTQNRNKSASLNRNSPRQAIARAWNEFQKIATEVDRPELIADLAPTLERFQLGLFRLVVMGEIKKGKSSFINALLGEPGLLPTKSDVATSTVYKLMYGPTKKFKVFFQPDIDTGQRQASQEIQESQLSEFGTEDGNPQNRKRVDFLGIELPNSMLKEGLVLVDTPGVGGLFKSHRDITWRYAPNADAIFFVLDSVESVISRDEIEFLKELTSKITKRIFFIQTKIDACDTEQWQGWRERNCDLLSKELGIDRDKIYYFPISSKLKAIADKSHDGELLTESGFLTVIDFLHRGLVATKEQQMARDVARSLGRGCQEVCRGVEGQLQICRQETQEALDRLAQDYRLARDELERWERTTYRQEMVNFSDGFSDYRQRALSRLQQELDPIGGIAKDILESLRAQQIDAKKLNDTAGQTQQACIARAADCYQGIQREFNERVTNLIIDVSKKLSRELFESEFDQLPIAADAPAIRVEESLNMMFSTFDDLRTSVYGGMAGAMITNVGLGLISLVFPPAAAVAGFAALIGGFVGACQAEELANARKREEALAKLQVILQNLLRNVQQQAISHFNELSTQFERRARNVFEKSAERARNDLTKRIQDVESTRSGSKEAAQAKARKLDTTLKALNTLRNSLRTIANDGLKGTAPIDSNS